jgi:hypothetical protein
LATRPSTTPRTVFEADLPQVIRRIVAAESTATVAEAASCAERATLLAPTINGKLSIACFQV